MIPHETHLQIGSLVFEGLDQIDLTGPFEVLSRIPNSTYRLYGKTAERVRDVRGLRLTPDAALADAPPLDVLHVPGGFGQEALMEDAELLAWLRRQAATARSVFSVCTGALLCGAAGLLHGRRATTHWASFHLLPFFGAIPVNGWSSTGVGSLPPASPPGSTALCGSRRSCAARKPPKPFSSTWPMRPSRLSTVARPRPRHPASWRRRGKRRRRSRRSGKQPRGVWQRGSALPFPIVPAGERIARCRGRIGGN